MDSSDKTGAAEVVREIAEGLRGGVAAGNLEGAASRYADFCEQANRRLARCAEMLKEGGDREHDALMEAMRSPDLRELSVQLSDPALEGWRGFCEKHRLPVPASINRSALGDLDSVYARVRGGGRSVPETRSQADPSTSGPAVSRSHSVAMGSTRPGPPSPVYSTAATIRTRSNPAAGGSRAKMFTVAGAGIVTVAAAAAFLAPSLLESSKAGRLSSELNALMAEGRWREAGELVESQEDIVAKGTETSALRDSLAVCSLAEEMRGLAENFHQFPGYRDHAEPGVMLDAVDVRAAGSGVEWAGHPELARLREKTGEQLEQWGLFQESAANYWRALAGLESPGEAPESVLSRLVDGQESGPASHAAGEIDRIGRVADEVRNFNALRGEPAENSEELRRRCGEISDRLLAQADGAGSREARIINGIAATVLRFEPDSLRPKPTAVAAATPAEGTPNGSPPVEVTPGELPKKTSPAPLADPPEAETTGPAETEIPQNTGSHPAARSSKRPPTFVVLWKSDFNWRIDLGSAGIPLTGPAQSSEIRMPEKPYELLNSDRSTWVPIIGNRIRESLSGAPVFERKRSGNQLVLQGNVTAGFREKFGKSWLMRFAEDTSRTRPDYQVLIYHPDPGMSGYLLQFPLESNLSRTEKGGQTLQLAPPLVAELSSLILSDEPRKGRLFLGLKSDGETIRSEPVEFADGPMPFSKLRLDLSIVGGPISEKERIEEQWKKLTGLKAAQETFNRSFAKAGDPEQLFKGLGMFEIETSTRTFSSTQQLSLVPVEESTLPDATLTEYVKKHGASGIRPPLLDYLGYLFAETLGKDREIFDFGKSDSPERKILGSLERVRAPGGWRKESDFQSLRKQLDAVTSFAGGRPLVVPDAKAPLPDQMPGESSNRYLERMNERQRQINTDRFFQNWARIFSSGELDKVWPWIVSNGIVDDPGTLLKSVEDRRSALQKKAADLAKIGDSLGSLGRFFVDCEVVWEDGPPQTVQVIEFEDRRPTAKLPDSTTPQNPSASPK